MLNNKFLDKILKEYDYSNISIGTLKPVATNHVPPQIHYKTKGLSYYGNRKKNRNKDSFSRKHDSLTRKQDRECTIVNDPTLDSLEIKKIDEAMAKFNSIKRQNSSIDDKNEIL